MNRFLLAPFLVLTLGASARAEEAAPLPIAPASIQTSEPLEASLRQALVALSEPQGDSRDPLPQVLEGQIKANQPRSGEALLTIIADEKSPLNRRAVNAFVQCWKSMSAVQISAYLRAAIVLDVDARPHYPVGFNVYVGCSYKTRFGWGGFPSQSFKLKTRTIGLLDGKPWDNPYVYEGPMGGTYPLQTGKLSLGEHTVSLHFEFDFEQNGEHRSEQMESRPFKFSIVDSELLDDLEGVKGTQEEGLLKSFFHVAEPAKEAAALPGQPDPWQPQSTWSDAQGQGNGLHGPVWNLEQALPFALTFDVEIVDADGRVFKGDQVLVKAGQSYGSYFMPYTPQEFADAHPNTDWVPVKIVLQPSYARALCYPDIKSFYAGKLQFENLHLKIIRPNPKGDFIPPPG